MTQCFKKIECTTKKKGGGVVIKKKLLLHNNNIISFSLIIFITNVLDKNKIKLPFGITLQKLSSRGRLINYHFSNIYLRNPHTTLT